MPKEEHPLQILTTYLPIGSFDFVVNYIKKYKIHLTITKARKSVLGDYRHAIMGRNHRISINGNLNKYEFLITFLHELAHLLTFEVYANKVEPHGKEWKQAYSNLLIASLELNCYPADIVKGLKKSIQNPAATANGETNLLLLLRKHNENINTDFLPIAELPFGSIFQTEKGKVFRKDKLRRKRFECTEIQTGLKYSFSSISLVKKLEIPTE